MAIGKRVFLQRPLPDADVIAQFARIPVANICDAMERASSMHPRIRLLSRPQQPGCAGAALTVKTRAGDNLALHKAIDIAKPGDFIIVDTEGDNFRSITGEIMIATMVRKKLAGLIIDGPVRDIDYIETLDFPVYATGTNPGGPYKNGPGEVNVPVSCGGRAVMPGDIVVADGDGIIIIPRRDGKELLEKAKQVMENDQAKAALARDGQPDRSWVDRALDNNGFEIIDDCYQS